MSKNIMVLCKPWEDILSADDTNMSFFREDVAHVLLACMTDFVQNMRRKTVQIHLPVVRVGGTHMKLRRLGYHYFMVIIYLHQIWVSRLFDCKTGFASPKTDSYDYERELHKNTVWICTFYSQRKDAMTTIN